MKIQYILLFLVFNFFTIKAQESLFNGKNLDGWTVHGTELWYVEDSLLVCESGPDKAYGYLSTDKYYDDFELTLVDNNQKMSTAQSRCWLFVCLPENSVSTVK